MPKSPSSLFLFFCATIALLNMVWPSRLMADDGRHLFDAIGRFNQVDGPACADDKKPTPVKPGLIDRMNPFDSALKLVRESNIFRKNTYKSEGELRRYLECYTVETGRYDVVEKTYMPLIREAAKSFEIPPTVLACLIFRESRFNINAVSPTGATGLGQHLSDTLEHISNILSPKKEKETSKLLLLSKQTVKERVESANRTVEGARKDITYAKNVLTDRDQRLKWENYYAQLSSLKLNKGAIPRKLTKGSLQDPKIAIGATAMYLRMILSEFKKSVDDDIQVSGLDKSSQNYHLLLAAAGAYNMGPGAAQKILLKSGSSDPKKWVEELKESNEETAAHLLSIRNCMESSASNEGNAWKGPIGSATYECNDGNESTVPRVVVGASNKLPIAYRNQVKSATLTGPKKKEVAAQSTSASVKKTSTPPKKTTKTKTANASAKATRSPAEKASKAKEPTKKPSHK